MLALLGGFLVKLLGSGIVTPVLEYFKQKNSDAAALATAQVGADKDRDLATLQAAADANKLKATAQPEFRWLIYLIALPPALQMSGIYLDSMPFWTPWGAHVIGSWGVPKPPAPYDDYQRQIVLSFFIVAPTVQAIKGAAAVAGAALSRR